MDEPKKLFAPDEPRSVAFIHSKLDDYGLSAAQFRVFCRVARRGDCFEAIENISVGCRLHRKTTEAAIKFLCQRRLLSKEFRLWQSNIYRIRDIGEWLPPLTLNEYSRQNN